MHVKWKLSKNITCHGAWKSPKGNGQYVVGTETKERSSRSPSRKAFSERSSCSPGWWWRAPRACASSGGECPAANAMLWVNSLGTMHDERPHTRFFVSFLAFLSCMRDRGRLNNPVAELADEENAPWSSSTTPWPDAHRARNQRPPGQQSARTWCVRIGCPCAGWGARP